nr:class I SAM-dependent methyltransferase [Novosphingobium marinum]
MPDPSTARLLEVGGGDCVNLLSLAAAWPKCDAHGFDLSEAAIGRGQDLVKAGRFDNVTLAVDDVMEAHKRYPARSFDYVVVHGLYAWVPPQVREGILELLDHVLSDNGVAFVSYNAIPGGHFRKMLRDTIKFELEGVDDPDEVKQITMRVLHEYRDRTEDHPMIACLKEHVDSMLDRPWGALFHDELGEVYYPQKLVDVVRAGARHNLRYLTDSGRHLKLQGFFEIGEDAPFNSAKADELILRRQMRGDFRDIRFFRQSLFVRPERRIDRTIDFERLSDMWLATPMSRGEDGRFHVGKDNFEIPDGDLSDALEQAGSVYPLRVKVSDIARGPDQLRPLLAMFAHRFLTLHPGPEPWVRKPGEHPKLSPMVRAKFGAGDEEVFNLAQDKIRIAQPPLRAFLAAADGSRTIPEIAAMELGVPAEETEQALTVAAQRALLIA